MRGRKEIRKSSRVMGLSMAKLQRSRKLSKNERTQTLPDVLPEELLGLDGSEPEYYCSHSLGYYGSKADSVDSSNTSLNDIKRPESPDSVTEQEQAKAVQTMPEEPKKEKKQVKAIQTTEELSEEESEQEQAEAVWLMPEEPSKEETIQKQATAVSWISDESSEEEIRLGPSEDLLLIGDEGEELVKITMQDGKRKGTLICPEMVHSERKHPRDDFRPVYSRKEEHKRDAKEADMGEMYLNMVHREVLDTHRDQLHERLDPWPVINVLFELGTLGSFQCQMLYKMAEEGRVAVNRLLLAFLWRMGSRGLMDLITALYQTEQRNLAYFLVTTEHKVREYFLSAQGAANVPEVVVHLPTSDTRHRRLSGRQHAPHPPSKAQPSGAASESGESVSHVAYLERRLAFLEKFILATMKKDTPLFAPKAPERGQEAGVNSGTVTKPEKDAARRNSPEPQTQKKSLTTVCLQKGSQSQFTLETPASHKLHDADARNPREKAAADSFDLSQTGPEKGNVSRPRVSNESVKFRDQQSVTEKPREPSTGERKVSVPRMSGRQMSERNMSGRQMSVRKMSVRKQ